MRTDGDSEKEAASGRKPVFSPTRITTYLECAVKYRYIYLDRIGRFYLRPRAYYSFGSTLHQVLRQFHEQGASQTPEELVASLKDNWISAGYTSPDEEEHHRQLGEQIVAAYHKSLDSQETPRECVAIEKQLSYDMGLYILRGRIDRIDRHPDGTLEIIDYKSGLDSVTPEEVASSIAMCCYQLLVKRLYPEAPVCATIYCLRTGASATVALTDAALNTFADDLNSLVKKILQTDFTLVYPIKKPICETCDFLSRCQRVWREKKDENR